MTARPLPPTAEAHRHRPLPAWPVRLRAALVPLTGVAVLALAACAAPPPAPRLLRWPLQPAGPVQAAPATASAAGPAPNAAIAGAWQLIPWGATPEWMDRQELLVADGPAGARVLPGVRWAEPPRDALPRLLALDLTALRAPQTLWTGVLPPGTAIARQLRVQVLALDNLPQPGVVRLLARWSLVDPAGRQPPQLVDERIDQPWDGSPDGLVLAQRSALHTLARHIARGPGQ